MSIHWSIPQPPPRDLPARLGRRWAVTCDGLEVHARPAYCRFWSQDKAQACADHCNQSDVHWRNLGLDEDGPDRWAVTDLMAGSTDPITMALGIAESAGGWIAVIAAIAMVVIAIVTFAAAVSS